MSTEGATAVAERPAGSDQPLLAVEGVTARFGGVVAVDNVLSALVG